MQWPRVLLKTLCKESNKNRDFSIYCVLFSYDKFNASLWTCNYWTNDFYKQYTNIFVCIQKYTSIFFMRIKCQSRRTCVHLLFREFQNYTRSWTTINRRMLDPTKIIPHIQGKRRSHSKMIGGAKLHLEPNPISARDAQSAQTKPFAHQTKQRLSQICLWVFKCLLWRCGSAVACCRDRGSGCSRPGSHSMWHKPSWRKSPLVPP